MGKIEFNVENQVVVNRTLANQIVKAVDDKKHIEVSCNYTSKGISKIIIVTDDSPINKKAGIIKQGHCFLGEISHNDALEMKLDIEDGSVPKLVTKELNRYLKLTNSKDKGEKEMVEKKAELKKEAQVKDLQTMQDEVEIVEGMETTEEGKVETVEGVVEKAMESLGIDVKQVSVNETDEVENAEVDKEEERRRKEELQRKNYEQRLENKRNMLEMLTYEGSEQLDESTMVVAEDITGKYKVFMRAMKSIKDNQRKYLIAEMNSDGVEIGTEAKSALFTASDIKKGATKIDNWIGGFEGIYDGMMVDIKRRMTIVEKCRLLDTATILTIGEKTFEQIFSDLEKWLSNNLEDSIVGCCKIKDEYHVGIVRRGEKTPDKLFKEVFKEIAPYNSYDAFKRELYRKDLVFHDYNDNGMDFQKGLSLSVRERLGVVSDKMISIKFDKKVRKEMYVEYCWLNNLDLDLEDISFDEDSAA